jgi:uncharacterized coiled-coil DUF342 family protein
MSGTKVAELAKTIEAEFDFVNEVAQSARTERDRLNGIVKVHAARLGELNSQSRALKQAAVEHFQNRNSLNQRVKDGKSERDRLNVAANNAQDALVATREKLMPTDNTLLNQLKREFKQCERRQMTSAMSQGSEKRLVEAISKISLQMATIEKKFAGNSEIQKANDAFKVSRLEAEIQHALVSGMALDAQNEHAMMNDLFHKRDLLVEEADSVHALMMEIKKVADAEHERFKKYATMAYVFKQVSHLLANRKGRVSADDIAIGTLLKGGKLTFSEMAVVQKQEIKKKKHKKQK